MPVVSSRRLKPCLITFSLLVSFAVTSNELVAQTKQTEAKESTAESAKAKDKAAAKKSEGKKNVDAQKGWKPLLDKSSLKGWKVTNYGGEGEAEVKDSVLELEQGVDLSGITTTRKDLPKNNYEVEFEARRTQGNDFFVGFTFPVDDSACSLICGGWGGGICGISSIDLMDASENETTSYSSFNNGQWYKVRVRVAGGKIEAWMDGKSLLEVDLEDRKLDTRFEMDLSKPMGFATYQSTAQIRKARIRKIAEK